MKTIYFNLRFLTQPFSGMQRYALELLSAVDLRLSEHPEELPDVRLIGLLPACPHRQVNWRRLEQRSIGKNSGHFWEQTALARAARGGPLVSLTGTGPIAHGCHVLALHDANVFENPDFFSRRYALLHRALRPRLARRARRLITISQFSRQELARNCGVDEERFTIIPDSAEHILTCAARPEVLTQSGLKPGAYALCVGNQSPNKNIALACSAFSEARPDGMKLAIVGGEAQALRSAMIDLPDWALPMGRVDDGALRALYENAAVFIFPSIYEGFGVPPLEAMLLGCPVVSSNSTAMPEVLGPNAFYFDCNDVEACSNALTRVFTLDQRTRDDTVTAARAHAQSYSWKTSADQLIAILKDLV